MVCYPEGKIGNRPQEQKKYLLRVKAYRPERIFTYQVEDVKIVRTESRRLQNADRIIYCVK
jgi:hypothetical protein